MDQDIKRTSQATGIANEEQERHLDEILQNLKLHVSKIGTYRNDVVRVALTEDIRQLEHFRKNISN